MQPLALAGGCFCFEKNVELGGNWIVATITREVAMITQEVATKNQEVETINRKVATINYRTCGRLFLFREK
jgi:hypothetical protein